MKRVPWHKRKVAYCAIKIRSRYTGEEIYLGTNYPSYAKAQAAAKRDVCERCNTYEIYPTTKDAVWIDRHQPLGVRQAY